MNLPLHLQSPDPSTRTFQRVSFPKMTMAIDSQQRQFGGGIPFDHMPYSSSANFSNPWASSSASPSQHLYASSVALHPNLGLGVLAKQQVSRINSHHPPMSTYAGTSTTTSSTGNSLMVDTYGQDHMATLSRDMSHPPLVQNSNNAAYGNELSYTSTPASAPSIYATTSPYDALGYTPVHLRPAFGLQPTPSRRLSGSGMSAESTRNFDAMDASQGMLAMSQNATPRNIYGHGARTGRGSGDAYGFSATHSTSSSISSNGNYQPYYTGSMDSSMSDYSGAGSDMESVSSRTLPRPSNLLGGNLSTAAPQSMMTQFTMKASTSSPKKHKCKVCDKRFTRPSSLQTHVYSHTGEKPFACEVDGCGRNFSVVSNLRRHQKVHRDDERSEAGSDHSDD